MKTASAGFEYAAQYENALMVRPTGGQTSASARPQTIAANAVTIGTNRFPAKKPR